MRMTFLPCARIQEVNFSNSSLHYAGYTLNGTEYYVAYRTFTVMYAKHVFDMGRRMTTYYIHIAFGCAIFYTIIHTAILDLPFLSDQRKLFMLGRFIYGLLIVIVVTLIFVFYFHGYQCMKERKFHKSVDKNRNFL